MCELHDYTVFEKLIICPLKIWKLKIFWPTCQSTNVLSVDYVAVGGLWGQSLCYRWLFFINPSTILSTFAKKGLFSHTSNLTHTSLAHHCYCLHSPQSRKTGSLFCQTRLSIASQQSMKQLNVEQLNEHRRCKVQTQRSSLMWWAPVSFSHVVVEEKTADNCCFVLWTNCQCSHIQHTFLMCCEKLSEQW